jgi:hypothetical protein
VLKYDLRRLAAAAEEVMEKLASFYQLCGQHDPAYLAKR